MNRELLRATATDAVVRAGELQLARFGADVQVDKKGAIDLVTDVDLEVERMFRRLIAERFPDHRVLAEELEEKPENQLDQDNQLNEREGDTAPLGISAAPLGIVAAPPGPCWIFDPIDGTTNYAHGLPIFCSSVALEIDGVAELAAVYDPTRRELFTAERGRGAFLNGRPLRVSRAATLVDAVLVTGFPYDVHRRVDEVVGLFGAFVGRARAVRRLGSAALDLCYVGAGRLDGFWESDLKPWDIAGGSLIVAEAGGCVTDIEGAPFTSRRGSVLASNGALHDLMLEVIRGFRAGRAPNRTK